MSSPGDRARDEGMNRASENAGLWNLRGQQLLVRLCERYAGYERSGEEINNRIVAEIGEPPNHPNAKSSLCGWGVQKGYLVDTGKPRVKLKKTSSHSRKTPVYRLVHPQQAVALPRPSRRRNGP